MTNDNTLRKNMFEELQREADTIKRYESSSLAEIFLDKLLHNKDFVERLTNTKIDIDHNWKLIIKEN